MRQPTLLLLATLLLTACQPEAAPPRPLQAAAVRPTAPRYDPVVNLPPSQGAVIQQTSNGWSHCDLIESGDVQCWGRNYYGQLGDGTFEARGTPRVILRDAVQIAMRELTSCALLRSGEVYCWGTRPGFDIAPLPTAATNNTSWRRQTKTVYTRPTRIEGLPPVKLISHAASQTCALTADGEVYCWGVDLDRAERAAHREALTMAQGALRGATNGEEGLDPKRLASRFVVNHAARHVEALSGTDMIWGGFYHHCARSTLGQVRCWGQYAREVGGEQDIYRQPTHAPLFDGAQRLAFNRDGVCMLRDDAVSCTFHIEQRVIPIHTDASIQDISWANSGNTQNLLMLTANGSLVHASECGWYMEDGALKQQHTILTDVLYINNPSAASPCVTLRDGSTTCYNQRRHPTDETRDGAWCSTIQEIER